MFGEIDQALRHAGFSLHKMSSPSTKVIPNSEIDSLVRSENRNQWIEADAIYIRDPARLSEFTHDQLRQMALVATGALASFDLALLALDALTERGLIPSDLSQSFATSLPQSARKTKPS